MSGREDGVPVTIRGVQYRSMAAAGRALGVSTVAIWKARAFDRLETVGLTRQAKTAQKHTPKVTAKPIRQSVPDAPQQPREPWRPTLPWETA